MEKIIWWWNMVYYFHVKWYDWFGRIITYPFTLIIRSKIAQDLYKKRGVEDAEKAINDGMKKAGITETYMEAYLSIILIMFPVTSVCMIVNSLLFRYNMIGDLKTFMIIGVICALIATFYWNKILFGNRSVQKKYFKDFDTHFEHDNIKKFLYGILSFLTAATLASSIIVGFVVMFGVL